MARPGNVDIQLDLFLDYANNVKLYPSFHEYFRKWKPPLLAIWGKHDLYFIPAGAEAFRRDNPNATVQFLDRDISPSKRTLRKLLSRCGFPGKIVTRRAEAQRGPRCHRRSRFTSREDQRQMN